MASGLIAGKFSKTEFESSYIIENSKLILLDPRYDEQLAQLISAYLQKKLLKEKKKFSFETVFSHESKLDLMREANKAGYKVYLYFVATESPEINKDRVRLRKAKGKHDVPADLIESRYYRSLDLLHAAAQETYQTYFFDNSGLTQRLFAHFKMVAGEKVWDEINESNLPNWFIEYYVNKVSRK